MIRTLRITSIIAGILAISLIASVGVYGIQGDSEVKELLNSLSVVDQYKKAERKATTDAQNHKSPLVEQAEAYVKQMNPPSKRVNPDMPENPARRNILPPRVSAKFKLLGTSHNPADPGSSIALIDNPGDGLFWVRPSQKIGHTLIKEIKDGILVIEDSRGVRELSVENHPPANLVEVPGDQTSIQKMPRRFGTGTKPQNPAARRRTPVTRTARIRTERQIPPRPETPSPTPEDAHELESIVNQLRDLKENMNIPDKTDEEREMDEQTRTELMERLILLQKTRAARVRDNNEENLDQNSLSN